MPGSRFLELPPPALILFKMAVCRAFSGPKPSPAQLDRSQKLLILPDS
jgi:hypothetical protein